MALVVAKTWVGGLALGLLSLLALPLLQEEPGSSWRSCLQDASTIQAAAAGPRAALASIRATHREAMRLAGLHRNAADRIRKDPRWKEADQVEDMERALDAEWGTAAEQAALAEDAMATAGCIENEI